MSYKYLILLIFLLVHCISSNAQTFLSGVVVDSDNQNVLKYVNIGIKQKNIGTTSLIDGTFSILIPAQNEKDTLTFSLVGYSEINITINSIIVSNRKIFSLKTKSIPLNQVVIKSRKLVEQNYGVQNNGALLHFTDGSTNQNDIFEIGQLIKLDTSLSKITSVNLYINESRNDSGTFRINFYRYNGNKPTERIIEQSIVQEKPIHVGWLRFELSEYSVYLKGNFIVTIEFIPSKRKNNPIYYGIKLGGTAKSYLRTSSEGTWIVPPHHYRLYVTALVNAKSNNLSKNYLEDKDSKPTICLYSQFVKDTFSIFISLPNFYYKKGNQKFQVIYLLDANAYFDIVANEIQEKNSDVILVGIGYKDFLNMDSLRNRDYTFPQALATENFPKSGGAPNFLSFINNELIPFIDSRYKTDIKNRTMMGHSLGGYFTLFALKEEIINRSNSFKNYVAASPSLDYCDNYLSKKYQEITSIENPISLYMTLGGKEDSEDNLGTESKDNFESFVHLLSSSRFYSIKMKSEIFPLFGHMETAIPTFNKSIKLTE